MTNSFTAIEKTSFSPQQIALFILNFRTAAYDTFYSRGTMSRASRTCRTLRVELQTNIPLSSPQQIALFILNFRTAAYDTFYSRGTMSRAARGDLTMIGNCLLKEANMDGKTKKGRQFPRLQFFQRIPLHR